jgi:hypothetical protein
MNSTVEIQTVSSPARGIVTNNIIYKYRENYTTMMPSSKISPFPHAPESTASHNTPSFILDEALAMLGQPSSHSHEEKIS